MNAFYKSLPCVNVSQDHVRTTQFWGQEHRPIEIEAAPGAVVELPEAWCHKRHWSNNDHPSILEMIAPQMVPCDSAAGRKFLAAQEAAKAAMRPAPKPAPVAKPAE